MRKRCEDYVARLLARVTNSAIELEQRFVDYRNGGPSELNFDEEHLDMTKFESNESACDALEAPFVVDGETVLSSELCGEFLLGTLFQNCRIFVDVPITTDYDYVNCVFEVDVDYGLRSQHPNGRPLRVVDSTVVPRETVRA